jgi:hypothetical protein
VEACLLGLRLVTEWIRQPAHLESDCSTLTKALETRHSSRSACAGIIEEIRTAWNLLPDCTSSHIRREANKVAHELAHRVIKF